MFPFSSHSGASYIERFSINPYLYVSETTRVGRVLLRGLPRCVTACWNFILAGYLVLLTTYYTFSKGFPLSGRFAFRQRLTS